MRDRNFTSDHRSFQPPEFAGNFSTWSRTNCISKNFTSSRISRPVGIPQHWHCGRPAAPPGQACPDAPCCCRSWEIDHFCCSVLRLISRFSWYQTLLRLWKASGGACAMRGLGNQQEATCTIWSGCPHGVAKHMVSRCLSYRSDYYCQSSLVPPDNQHVVQNICQTMLLFQVLIYPPVVPYLLRARELWLLSCKCRFAIPRCLRTVWLLKCFFGDEPLTSLANQNYLQFQGEVLSDMFNSPKFVVMTSNWKTHTLLFWEGRHSPAYGQAQQEQHSVVWLQAQVKRMSMPKC